MLNLHCSSGLRTWLITLWLACFVLAHEEGVQEHLKEHILQQASLSHAQLTDRYLSDFTGLDRSIIGRQNDDVQTLSNNAPKQSSIDVGATQYYTFSQSDLQQAKSRKPTGLPSKFLECPSSAGGQSTTERPKELRVRQNEPNFYISLNTCDQPSSKSPIPKKTPEQLKVYISTDPTNTKPSEGKRDYTVPVSGGHGSFSLKSNKDIFITVTAPSSNDFTGSYNYEITASIDDYYAKYNNGSASKFIDSDKQSALIYTLNTTSCNSSDQTFQTWQSNAPPYRVFITSPDDPSIVGLQRSLCGLEKHAQIRTVDTVRTSITIAGGGQPKQQFYISGLNASSSYNAIVALEGTDGNSTSIGGGKVNGGGQTWAVTNFTTKSSPNCAVIYGLDFCSEVAYAVPSNSTDADKMADLRAKYDKNAADMYQNFTKSLQQIPCDTTDSAQYSLAVTCDDCAAAYKTWLCAVTVPRCEDFSNNASYLLPRSIGSDFIDPGYGAQFTNDPTLSAANKSISYMQSSRNPLIDQVIKPGPYKELLPCEDLCYGLVRSCPAALGFACPLEGHGLNNTYAKLKSVGQDVWTCNFPGTDLNGATGLRRTLPLLFIVVTISSLWLLFT